MGAVAAQYNYQKPEAPKNTYLPPATPKPLLSQEQIAADGLNPDVSRNIFWIFAYDVIQNLVVAFHTT